MRTVFELKLPQNIKKHAKGGLSEVIKAPIVKATETENKNALEGRKTECTQGYVNCASLPDLPRHNWQSEQDCISRI